jgi:tape measure domain-containing protein
MASNREQYIVELIDRGVTSGLKDIAKDVQKLREKMDGLDNTVGKPSGGGLAGSLAGLGRIVGWGALVAGAGMLGREIYQLGANMEQTRVSFGVFMGDQKKANDLIAQMQSFGKVTPYETTELLNSSRLLLSAGIEATKIPSYMKVIGDVASGTNVPIEEMSQIFMKVTNKGKLMTEELNQFSERGVPLIAELSKMYGISRAEVYKLGEQGLITSDVMNQAFTNMTSSGGIFHDMMNKQSQTTAGKMSTFVDNLKILGLKLADMLLPAVNAFIDFGTYIMDNKKLLGDIAIVLGIATGAFVAFKIAMFASTLATSGMTVAQYALNLAMSLNPIGLIVIAISALVAGVILVIRHFNEWGAVLSFLSVPFGLIIGLIQSLRRNWDGIKEAFSSGGILAGLKKIGTVILDVLLMPIQQLLELIAKIPGMESLAGGGADWIKNFRKKLGLVVPEETKKVVKDNQLKFEKIPGVGDTQLKAIGNDQKLKTANKLIKDKKEKTGKTDTNLKSGISEITAGAPKVFNINIGSLINEQSFTTNKDFSEIKTQIKAEISRLLLGVVNDVQTT